MSISCDWDKHRACDLIDKKILAIGDGYRAKNSELDKTGIPFARAGNINNGFNFEGADLFPENTLKKVGEKISQPGDVVFTSKGTVGRFGFVRIETPRFVYSPQLCYWRSLDPKIIDPRFLYYWMQGGEFWSQAEGVKGQTDMADYVSLGDQRRMFLTLPPHSEQCAIARMLGTLDDKIELNYRMNRNLQTMAQAIFRSWFVDFEPVSAKREGRKPVGMDDTTAALFPEHFLDTDIGPIPAGWRNGTLAELAKITSGKRPGLRSATKTAEMPIPIFGGGGIMGFTDQALCSSKMLLTGRVGTLGVIFRVSEPCWPSDNTLLLSCTARDHEYVFQLLDDVDFDSLNRGSTQPLVTQGDLLRLKVLIPHDEILEKYHGITADMFSKIDSNNKCNEMLSALRDTLIPQLLSGELRVGQAEKMIGEA